MYGNLHTTAPAKNRKIFVLDCFILRINFNFLINKYVYDFILNIAIYIA